VSNHYAETKSLYGGQVFIYSLASSIKKTFQARITLPGNENAGKVVRRSLRTTQIDEAIYLAQDLYLKLRARDSQGLPLSSISFNNAFLEYVEQRRGIVRFSERECDQYLATYERYFRHFFTDYPDISAITTNDIDAYWEWRRSFWKEDGFAAANDLIKPLQNGAKEPSWATLNKEVIRLRNLFRYAFKQGYTGTELQVESPARRSSSANVRKGFSPEEYGRLIRAINGKCQKKARPKGRKKNNQQRAAYFQPHVIRGWKALRAWALVIANTGIRVEELARIRWEQVELRHDAETGENFTIIHVSKSQSKTKNRLGDGRSVISRDYDNTYRYLMRWKEEASYVEDNDLIFTADRRRSKFKVGEYSGGKGIPIDFSYRMRSILRELDLHTSSEGGIEYKRSGTSLRHFYCSMRLMEGCPIKPLAENMGTSVAMIEQVYSHLIPWNMRDFLTRHTDGAAGVKTRQPNEAEIVGEET